MKMLRWLLSGLLLASLILHAVLGPVCCINREKEIQASIQAEMFPSATQKVDISSPSRADLAENTSWSNITVAILENLTVPQGRVLNITAGTTVVFQGNYTLAVDGRLNCSGNRTSPVRFTGNASRQNSSRSRLVLNRSSDFNFDFAEFTNISGAVWKGNGTMADVTFTNCTEPLEFVDAEVPFTTLRDVNFSTSPGVDVYLEGSNVSLVDCVGDGGARPKRQFVDASSHLEEWITLVVRALADTGEPLSGCDVTVRNESHSLYSSPHFGGADPATDASGDTDPISVFVNYSSMMGWLNSTVNISLHKTTSSGTWDSAGNVRSSDALGAHSVLAFTSSDIYPPEPPTDIRVTQINNTALNISWTPGGSSDVESHGLFLNVTGNWTQVENVSHHRNHAVYGPVNQSANYSFRLRAYDDVPLASEYTAAVNFTAGDVESPGIMGYAPLGKNISLATPIAIRFSEPMDELSVKSAFTVHPIANHGTDFLDNDTLFLATPYSPMYAAALYTVELTTAATDRAGNHLPENLTFNFTTEPDTSGPVVVETRPTGHNISRNDYIEVRFNEWVNESSYIDGFSVEPHMEGEFLSSNGRKTFSFYPTDPLDFGTSYRVTLHGSIEDFTGNTMGEDYTFNFTTVPAPDISTPEITAFGPVGENRSIHSKLFLEFSESMSTMVFAALSITPDIIFEYNHSKNQTYFEFRPVRPLAGATTFSVTVSPDASDLAGNSMARLFNFNFTTHETRSPRVIGSSPIHNELDVALDARITFRFDERVFSGPDFMINFVPQTNFSWNIENENNSLVIHPTLSLIEDVGYSVTVKGLADAFDNVITPTTLRFSTMRTEKDDDREFLEVYQYYPDVLRNVPVNTPVYVTFHESLDVESIGDDTFRLLENNETRIVGSTRYDGDTTLSFDPARGLKPNTTYTARVSGVLSARGGRGLERPLYFTFTTRPPEYTLTVVLDFRPENGSTIDYRKENVTIWILFSSPMQLDSLGKNLVFLPEVNFTLVPEANYRLFRVHLAEDLLPSTGYEVTIGGLSTDENGTIMGETVSFQFSTKVGGEKARKEDRSWIRDNIFYLTVGIIVMMVLGVLFLRPGKIKSLPGEIPCPECDRPILRDDRKCWNCGKSLMEDAEEEKEEEDDDEVEGEEEEDEEDEDAGEEEDPEDEEGKGDDEVEEGEGDEEGKGDDKVGEGEGAEEGKGDDEVEEDEGDEDGVEGTGENGTHKEGEDEKGDDRGEDGVEEDGDDGTDEGQGDEG